LFNINWFIFSRSENSGSKYFNSWFENSNGELKN
jgi:hypothetical protein